MYIDPSVELTGDQLSATQGGADVYQWVDCGNRNQPLDGATDQAFTPDVRGGEAKFIAFWDAN